MATGQTAVSDILHSLVHGVCPTSRQYSSNTAACLTTSRANESLTWQSHAPNRGTQAALRSCLGSRGRGGGVTEQAAGGQQQQRPHLKMAICSAKVALCLRRVCFMRVSARVLVGLSLGLSAGGQEGRAGGDAGGPAAKSLQRETRPNRRSGQAFNHWLSASLPPHPPRAACPRKEASLPRMEQKTARQDSAWEGQPRMGGGQPHGGGGRPAPARVLFRKSSNSHSMRT